MILKKRPRSNVRVNKVAVLDLETKGLGGDFVLGGYRTADDSTVRVISDIKGFLLDIVLTKKGAEYDWYAHNGAKYDYLYFVTPAIRKYLVARGFTITPVMSNDRCHGLKISRGKRVWRLKDSYALTGLSLREFASIFAETQKRDIDWSREEFDPRNREHLAYLAADVQSLFESVTRYQDLFIRLFNAPLAWTTAGTALSAWRQLMPKSDKLSTITDQAERKTMMDAYYGGRTIVRAARVTANVHAYDVNSMYAAMMMKGVPIGASCYTKEYHDGLPGFYRVVATSVGDIPLLPKRDDVRTGLVYFPLGTFETTVTSLEIEFARRHGWTVEVIDGYVFDEIGHPFDEFINRCRKLRMRDYSGPIGTIAKNVQNHLYGKLAQSPEWVAYRVQMFEPEPSQKFGEWLPDFIPGKRHIRDMWFQNQNKEDPLFFPHWAAWITSQARVFVMQSAIDEGWDRVLYSDTDSLWLEGEARTLTVGSDYGQWKHQHESVTMMVLAPKTYMFIKDGITTMRAKGIPRDLVTPGHFGEEFSGKTANILVTVINGMLAVMRGYGISWQQMRRLVDIENVSGYTYNAETREFLPIILHGEGPSEANNPAVTTGIKEN